MRLVKADKPKNDDDKFTVDLNRKELAVLWAALNKTPSAVIETAVAALDTINDSEYDHEKQAVLIDSIEKIVREG
jgi:hypothetical protein